MVTPRLRSAAGGVPALALTTQARFSTGPRTTPALLRTGAVARNVFGTCGDAYASIPVADAVHRRTPAPYRREIRAERLRKRHAGVPTAPIRVTSQKAALLEAVEAAVADDDTTKNLDAEPIPRDGQRIASPIAGGSSASGAPRARNEPARAGRETQFVGACAWPHRSGIWTEQRSWCRSHTHASGPSTRPPRRARQHGQSIVGLPTDGAHALAAININPYSNTPRPSPALAARWYQ